MDSSKQRMNVDEIVRYAGLGRTYGSVTDVWAGIDHRNAGASFQRNNDNNGLVLFTRPRLNLSYDNISGDRVFLPLLAEDTVKDASGKTTFVPNKSIYRAIRIMLDPLAANMSDRYIGSRGLKSLLFDEKQAFMPILTNTLLNVSGFPDITIDTYTAPEGIRKESWSMVDSVAELNSTYDITATFANIQGDPITSIFHLWVKYAGNVYCGDMSPYPDAVVENKIDYQTRIWRLILDNSRTYVKKIGCANAAFPMASPLGATFNYNKDAPSIKDNDQISIPFRCIGAEYQDPILYHEFNRTVQMFNPGMHDSNRESAYHKLVPTETNYYNFKGYPRIDPSTLELEWWVPKNEMSEVQK